MPSKREPKTPTRVLPPTSTTVPRPVLDWDRKMQASKLLWLIGINHSVVLEPKPRGLPYLHFRLNKEARDAHLLFLILIHGKDEGVGQHIKLLPDNGFLPYRESAAAIYTQLLAVACEHGIPDLDWSRGWRSEWWQEPAAA